MKKILLSLCLMLWEANRLFAQTVTPVYEVEDVAEFASLSYNLVMYDGSPWERKIGTITPNGGTTINGPSGYFYQRQYDGPINARWFGAKGDSTTNDQLALQKVLDYAGPGSVIDFSSGKYLFDSLTFPKVKDVKLINGVLMGTLIIGSKLYNTEPFNYYLELQSLKFDLSRFQDRTGKYGIVLANAKSINIHHTGFKGVSAAIYVYPHNKFQHVARVTIDNCYTQQDPMRDPNNRAIDYFVYVDNQAKNSPNYSGMVFGCGDLHITNNNDIHVTTTHVLAYGLDGAVISTGTFFMPGGYYKSQKKEQNIKIVRSNWVSINNMQLFEAGKEAVLIENSSNYSISACRIAWPGQKDASAGYGIRTIGPGYPDVNYTHGNIIGNIIQIPTRAGVYIGSGANFVSVIGNSTLSAGNGSFYYGDGTQAMGSENAVPAINPAIVNAGGWAMDTKRITFSGNSCDNKDFDLPFNSQATEYERNRQSGNFGLTGNSNQLSKGISSIVNNRIDVSNAQHILMNVTSGGSVDGLDGPVPGQVITIENGSVPFTLVNNAYIKLAGNSSTSIPYQGSITLLRKVGYWLEISRTYSPPSIKVTTSSDIEILDTTKGIIMKSPNGKRFRVKLDNSGNWVSQELTN